MTTLFIYVNYIHPEWINEVAEVWTKMMQDSGQTSEEIEKRIKGFREDYQTLRMFTISIVKFGLSQFVLGLIVSLFFVLKFKRK